MGRMKEAGVGIRIRDAMTEDIPGVLSMWKSLMEIHIPFSDTYKTKADAAKTMEAYLERIIAGKTDKDTRLMVAEGRSQLCGYAIAEVERRSQVFKSDIRIRICDIFVKREARDAGIGASLYKEIEGWAKSRRIRNIALEVDCRNSEAIRFYRKTGFAECRLVLTKEV